MLVRGKAYDPDPLATPFGDILAPVCFGSRALFVWSIIELMETPPDLRLVHSGEGMDTPAEQDKTARVLRVVRNTGIDFAYLRGLQHIDGNPFVKPPEPPDIAA